MSTIDSKYEFGSFTGDFYFREQDKNKSWNSIVIAMTVSSWETTIIWERKHQKVCVLHLKNKENWMIIQLVYVFIIW